jgi:hypothetical protein
MFWLWAARAQYDQPMDFQEELERRIDDRRGDNDKFAVQAEDFYRRNLTTLDGIEDGVRQAAATLSDAGIPVNDFLKNPKRPWDKSLWTPAGWRLKSLHEISSHIILSTYGRLIRVRFDDNNNEDSRTDYLADMRTGMESKLALVMDGSLVLGESDLYSMIMFGDLSRASADGKTRMDKVLDDVADYLIATAAPGS